MSDGKTPNAKNGSVGVYWLGIVILFTFFVLAVAVLYGSFQMLIGGITIKDVAVVATVSGLIGTVLGYVASNAQQVVNYFFGSSKGSVDKTDAMAAMRSVEPVPVPEAAIPQACANCVNAPANPSQAPNE